MKNSITATILFSFKGEQFSPCAHIDLDALLLKGQDLSQVHMMVASSSNVDPYSYAYEVMQVSDVTYSEASGLAEKFLTDNLFDFQAFSKAWTEQKNLEIIQEIAQKHMNIDNLEQHPELQAALMDALKQGS